MSYSPMSVPSTGIAVKEFEKSASELQLCRWTNSSEIFVCIMIRGRYFNEDLKLFYGMDFVDCGMQFH